jgi:hypothetical protein
VINLASRVVEPVVLFDSDAYLQIEWAADSQRLFYRHRDRGIVEHDTRSHAESVLVAATDMPGAAAGFGVRPDGTVLVVSEVESDSGREAVFKLWLTGRAAIQVARLKAPARLSAWMGDGDEFAYVQQVGPDRPIHLWVMSLDGRPARDLGPLHGYRQITTGIALHPNGRQVAYLNGTFRSALYILEQFLPD